MKVAVCASGEGLDAAVDNRFGRCAWFVVVDTESRECESIANSAANAGGGAGTAAAGLLSEHGVKAVLVGNLGPNAAAVLGASGIRAYTGLGETVRDTVDGYVRGEMVPVDSATVSSHFGSGRKGPGQTGGRGRGRA